MFILAHRGLVEGPDAVRENSLEAVAPALALGFGIETDIRRDRGGRIYIAHDATVPDERNDADSHAALWRSAVAPIALNYKEAGWDEELAALGEAEGLIMAFWNEHPKWSYAELSPEGLVTEVVEKVVVSDQARVGVRKFAHGTDFVRAAERMIASDLRVNGEFYVAPAYNLLVAEGARVVVHDIEKAGGRMHGLGTPEDLGVFLAGRAS